MKKILTIVTLAVLMQLQSFGHASTITRNWCGGIFHRKFVANARVSVLSYTTYQTGYDCIGRWVGKSPRAGWGTVCNNESKGCSRPQVAECWNSGTTADYIYSGCYLLFSGSHSYWGHAKASHLVSGVTLTQNSTGRGSAGWTDTFTVDSTLAAGLQADGWSQTNVTGNLSVDEFNNLVVTGLTGSVSIQQSKDYVSKIKVLVIKENEYISAAEAERLALLAQDGVYENIVYSSEIVVSKSSILKTGFFNGLPVSQLSQIDGMQEYGLNLNNVSVTIPLPGTLGLGEHYSVVTIVDGGFDISSAVIPNQQEPPAQKNSNMLVNHDEKSVTFYPNPTTNSINCHVYSMSGNENITIKAFDILGKELGQIYSGILQKGTSVIAHIDVSRLPAGNILLEVKVGSAVRHKRITIK